MSTSCIQSIMVYPQSGYLLVYHMGLSLFRYSYLSVELLQCSNLQKGSNVRWPHLYYSSCNYSSQVDVESPSNAYISRHSSSAFPTSVIMLFIAFMRLRPSANVFYVPGMGMYLMLYSESVTCHLTILLYGSSFFNKPTSTE